MEISHDVAQRGPLRFFARRVLSNHFWITILDNSDLPLSPVALLASTNAVKNVLFVFSIVKYSDEMLKVMQPYMRDHYPGPINFYYAYLEDIQSERKPFLGEPRREIYRRKYAGVKMDVVIANVGPSLRFALNTARRFFPRAADRIRIGKTKGSWKDRR